MGHEAQLAAGRALPGVQTEMGKDFFLPETFPGQAAHRVRLAFGTERVRINAALVRKFTRTH
jgi:hypothetical protein